tara:strand:- start:460 stop:1038 length:579 start_codon:yes stop_codon:yes gene_type:complete
MSVHGAIRDSIVETSRRVGRYNLDVSEMKSLMEFIERSHAGEEFTSLVRAKLLPAAQYIPTRNISEIAKLYPDFPLNEVADKVPTNELDAIFNALGMTNMLLTTMQMVPNEMMSKIEDMTSSMMGMIQSGGGGGSAGLNDLFKTLGPMMGAMGGMAQDSDSEEEDSPPKIKEVTNKKTVKKDRKQEFRDKLC